ncbi:MAG TPA: glucosaminidase domain-containing protein [Chitinophagaceae bacterium]|nr:glucosaminidase domain-containing protein [Chitinophagaceae bacterium]
MKKVALLFVCILAATVMYAQTDAVKHYIDTYREIAVNEMIRTGVPAAITLAQGILESQAGQSDLCQQSNNHFGIKCKDEWTGPYVLHDDDKKNECFRVYQNAEESFKDHSDFLKNRPYYTNLFSLAPDDYKGWAKGLKKDGYATERNYPQMLIKIIEDNNLQQYTMVALERMKNPNQPVYVSDNDNNGTPVKTAVATAEQQPSVNKATDEGDNDATGNANQQENAVKAAGNSNTENGDDENAGDVAVNADAYPDGVFTINQTRVVYAKDGTSLLALASTYNISYKSLLDFNDLGKGDILHKNCLIFLERKPKRSTKDYHIVSSSETIEDIAQKEGVRLESLLEYNALQKGSMLAAGTKVYLRAAQGMTAKSHKA